MGKVGLFSQLNGSFTRVDLLRLILLYVSVTKTRVSKMETSILKNFLERILRVFMCRNDKLFIVSC